MIRTGQAKAWPINPPSTDLPMTTTRALARLLNFLPSDFCWIFPEAVIREALKLLAEDSAKR